MAVMTKYTSAHQHAAVKQKTKSKKGKIKIAANMDRRTPV